MIGAYLTDEVTLRMDKGSDKWQEPNTTVDVRIRAFIDYGERKVQNAAGQLVVSTAKVWMRPRTIIKSDFDTRASKTISYKDLVIFDGELHGILRISKIRDFSVRGLEVYVA